MRTNNEHTAGWPVLIGPEKFEREWQAAFDRVFRPVRYAPWWDSNEPWPFVQGDWIKIPLEIHPLQTRYDPWPDDPYRNISDPHDLDPYVAWIKLFALLSTIGDDVWVCKCAPGFETWVKVQMAIYACAPMPPLDGYAHSTDLEVTPIRGCGKSGRWALLGDFDESAVFAAEPAIMNQYLDNIGGKENIERRFAYSAVRKGTERTYPAHCARFGWEPLDLKPFEKIVEEVYPPLE